MPTSYQIIEPHRGGTQQPMDGEIYHSKYKLFRNPPYADHDAMVIATDFDGDITETALFLIGMGAVGLVLLQLILAGAP